MRLTGKAGRDRDFCQGCWVSTQHIHRLFDPTPQNIFMRRFANGFSKHSGKVIGRQTRYRRQFFDCQGRIQIGIDIVKYPALDHWRQSTAHLKVQITPRGIAAQHVPHQKLPCMGHCHAVSGNIPIKGQHGVTHGLFDQGIKKERLFRDFNRVWFDVKGLNHRTFPRCVRDIKVEQLHLALHHPIRRHMCRYQAATPRPTTSQGIRTGFALNARATIDIQTDRVVIGFGITGQNVGFASPMGGGNAIAEIPCTQQICIPNQLIEDLKFLVASVWLKLH